jgi:hypothetical protein
MKKRDNGRRRDVNQLARDLVNLSTMDNIGDIQPPTKAQISLVMAQLGKKGGKIGGKRRLETMTADERTIAAQKAARARWGTKRKPRARKTE